MEAKFIALLALPVLLVVAVGFVGSTRRLGFWGAAILSVLLTPIGGMIVALLSGARRVGQRPRERKRLA